MLLHKLKNALKLFEVTAVMNIRPLLTAGCSRNISAVRMPQNNYDIMQLPLSLVCI
jgi:hypothetical protein